MSTYTVKVTESYWLYNVEADSREDAVNQTQPPLDQYDAGDYSLSIEAEEEDELN
jgi:hypothetical protein